MYDELLLDTRRNVLLQKYGFHFKHRLGQNFLTEPSVREQIADLARVDQDDLVVEIGAGSGYLTQVLAARAGHVIAVELDEVLARVLTELFAEFPNVTVLAGDALKMDYAQFADIGAEQGLTAPYKIVANLPYYITTPLLFHFLDKRYYWCELTLMMQKEVAERITAVPGTKDYGALTLAVAYDTDVRETFPVPADCFKPRPNVDSAVVNFQRRAFPPSAVTEREKFRKLVKAAFAQRRKTLQNALTNGGIGLDRELVTLFLKRAGIDGQRRGETLSFAEFAALANLWHDYEWTN